MTNEEKIRSILGEFEDYYERPNGKEETLITLTPTRPVKFTDLYNLSDLLGTDRINLHPSVPGTCYSSWTYDSGMPGHLEIFL